MFYIIFFLFFFFFFQQADKSLSVQDEVEQLIEDILNPSKVRLQIMHCAKKFIFFVGTKTHYKIGVNFAGEF